MKKHEQAELNEMREYLATKIEPHVNKNLIVNAEFNNTIKRKLDLIRARLKSEADARAAEEAKEKRRILDEQIAAEARRIREEEKAQKEKEDAARKAYMEK